MVRAGSSSATDSFGHHVVLGTPPKPPTAMLEVARHGWQGELLALIDPDNGASRNVLVKTGFEFVEPIMINGDRVELYRRSI